VAGRATIQGGTDARSTRTSDAGVNAPFDVKAAPDVMRVSNCTLPRLEWN
jgi:hypothetical protein